MCSEAFQECLATSAFTLGHRGCTRCLECNGIWKFDRQDSGKGGPGSKQGRLQQGNGGCLRQCPATIPLTAHLTAPPVAPLRPCRFSSKLWPPMLETPVLYFRARQYQLSSLIARHEGDWRSAASTTLAPSALQARRGRAPGQQLTVLVPNAATNISREEATVSYVASLKLPLKRAAPAAAPAARAVTAKVADAATGSPAASYQAEQSWHRPAAVPGAARAHSPSPVTPASSSSSMSVTPGSSCGSFSSMASGPLVQRRRLAAVEFGPCCCSGSGSDSDDGAPAAKLGAGCQWRQQHQPGHLVAPAQATAAQLKVRPASTLSAADCRGAQLRWRFPGRAGSGPAGRDSPVSVVPLLPLRRCANGGRA